MTNNVIDATLVAPEARIAIVVARFNEFVNNNLVEGAIDTLIRVGQIQENNIDCIKVPGAYEISLTVQQLALKGIYDGIIALGTIIRGGTAHFEYVAGPLSSSLINVSLKTNTPVGFGVLTVESIEQAIERAGTKMGNKGSEAAHTILEMINVKKEISQLK